MSYRGPGGHAVVPASSILFALLLSLAGCAVREPFVLPTAPDAAAFKEMPAVQAGAWKTAEPAEQAHRGQWWTVFGDPTLDALERQALEANQDLTAAAARLRQARAMAQAADADRRPSLDTGFGASRQRNAPTARSGQDDAGAQTLWRAQAGVAYEVDLFGRVSGRIEAAQADAARSEALFRTVQLALQADVAVLYFALRELDAQAGLYRQTEALRERALALVERRFGAGQIGELDVMRARHELASAQAEAIGIARQRSSAEHRLAILLGKEPANFSLPANRLAPSRIQVPAGLPSALLERRPDIAAAEQAMAAANARVGLARSAYFPRLDLTGAIGYESASLGDLFRWSSRTFLLGPLVGTALSLPIYDGGRRDARLLEARARFEEEVARYRQQVLVAFREVEDSLAELRLLDAQTTAQKIAVAASTRAERLSDLQYREGQVAYLDVIDAQRQVLQSQLQLNALAGARMAATVGLIRALGGGWETADALAQH